MLRYVELLSEARTPLGERCVSARRGWAGEKSDFFNILLVAYVGRVEYTRIVGRTHVVMSGNRR
jgi:hypothetical protein